MIIKAALTGDLHTNVARRAEEARRMAYWIVDDAVAKGAHFLGIGGDGIDGPMTEKDRAWLIEFSDYCGNRLPTLWIMGNHEPLLSLRCLRGRQTKHPVIVEEGADVHVIDSRAGQLAVAAVSFPTKAHLLAGIGRPVSGEEADQIAGQALQDVFRGLGVRVRELGLPTVGLVHGTIRGSKISDDQPDRPLGLDMDMADLALMGCDFICAPHIHKANQFSYGGVTAATPTSPLYLDYGEAKHFKGYILAEFDTEIVNAEPGDCATWSRISTPATPMLLVDLEWKELAGGWGWSDTTGDIDINGADVRLRFRFPSDQRNAATEAANGLAGLWRMDGAVNITLDPIVIPTTRSRIPQLATATRLEDKLKLYWQSIGFEPSAERETALIDALHELQNAAAAQGVAIGTTGRAAPVLQKFKANGIFKFNGPLEIDFSAIEGPLTAIVAPNESGKSILIQIMGPGVLYGTTPTRGSLDDLATENGAFVEAEFTMGGDEYKITQVASTKSATGRTSYPGTVSVLKNGKAELGNKSAGGRDEYKAWAAKNLLPPSMYDAIICQSGTESVIDMKDGPRVELLLKVLGLEFYEALAGIARSRASSVADKLSGVRGRIEELGSVEIETLERQVSYHDVAENENKSALAAKEAALKEAQAKVAEISKRQQAYQTLLQRRDELVAQIKVLQTRRELTLAKIETNRKLLDEKAAIEQAVVDVGLLEVEIASKPLHNLDLELAKAKAEEARIRADHQALVRRAGDLIAQEQKLAQRFVDNDSRLSAARTVTADADSIQQAVLETQDLQTKLKAKWEEDHTWRVKEAELAGVARDLQARVTGNDQRRTEAQRRLNRAEVTLKYKDVVRESVATVEKLTKNIATKERELKAYQDEVVLLQETLTGSKDTRIKSFRTGCEEIVSGAEAIPVAERLIEHDDDLHEEAEAVPSHLVDARKQVDFTEIELRELRKSLQDAQQLAARQAEIDAAELAKTEAEKDLDDVSKLDEELKEADAAAKSHSEALIDAMKKIQGEILDLDKRIKYLAPTVERAGSLATAAATVQNLEELQEAITTDRERLAISLSEVQQEAIAVKLALDDADLNNESLRSKIAAIQKEVAGLNSKIDALQPLAQKAPALAVAESVGEELLHQISTIDDELEALEHKRDGMEPQLDAAVVSETIDLDLYETAVASARTVLAETQKQLALVRQALSDAQAKAGRRKALESELNGLEQSNANWTLLGQHFGKDGLQKEEISVAGPQLTEITNDLLRSAGDTRHTLTIETERLHSNKKQMIPCLDLNIFDGEEGVTKESRRLSDGGKVLVGEPFSLALVILGCQRAGVKGVTIFRDEATGVLDPENSPRYLAMLRRMAEILQARVIFISQKPEMWDLADSRIFIDAGKLRVD